MTSEYIPAATLLDFSNPIVVYDSAGTAESVRHRDDENERLMWAAYTSCCMLPVSRCGCENFWHRNVLPPMVLQLLCAVAGHQ